MLRRMIIKCKRSCWRWKLNNSWNRMIYKVWSLIYDRIFNSGIFLKARKRVFDGMSFKGDQKILIVGVGTGADIELLNLENIEVTAIDLSYDMLRKARSKSSNSSIEFKQMDAQNLLFKDESFDTIIASLILSVVPDPEKSLTEMERVLKKHGRIIIFDKFAPKEKQLPFTKKLIRPVVRMLGTDIGLHFEYIFQKVSDTLTIENDVPIMLNGMYRKIVIRK